MEQMGKQKINPLSRRPGGGQKRLVVAVRGAAGTGKSTFAASLNDAGLGRLCLFDTERKSRLLDGVLDPEPPFDAIEIYEPDELPEFIEWALTGEAKGQFGCYALDSWALYFGRKYRQTLERVRERTGDPTAEPSAEQLQNDQMVYQEVLRRLCIDSGRSVVITDQIAAKGKETKEENEMGKVLPSTITGLEFFVDVMLEMELRLEGFEEVIVATVIKSNTSKLPVGTEFRNPVFKDLLDRLDDVPKSKVDDDIPEFLKPTPAVTEETSPLQTLKDKAAEAGIGEKQLTTAARHYHGKSALEALSPAEVQALLERMAAKLNAAEVTPEKGKGKVTK